MWSSRGWSQRMTSSRFPCWTASLSMVLVRTPRIWWIRDRGQGTPHLAERQEGVKWWHPRSLATRAPLGSLEQTSRASWATYRAFLPSSRLWISRTITTWRGQSAGRVLTDHNSVEAPRSSRRHRGIPSYRRNQSGRQVRVFLQIWINKTASGSN